jgi:hypothetical protein
VAHFTVLRGARDGDDPMRDVPLKYAVLFLAVCALPWLGALVAVALIKHMIGFQRGPREAIFLFTRLTFKNAMSSGVWRVRTSKNFTLLVGMRRYS